MNDPNTPPMGTPRAAIVRRVLIAAVIVTIAVVYVWFMVGPSPP